MIVRKLLGLAGLLVLAFTAAACAADTAALQPTVLPATDTAAPPPTDPPPPAEGNAEEPTAAAENEPADTQAPPEPTPTDDGKIPMPELGFDYGAPLLKASDPTQFVRATGKPQLVELFAFW